MAAQLTQFDLALASAVSFEFNNGTADRLKVLFQYPPKITSDDRKGDWKEPNQYGTEPVATFSGSGPREIALTWTYVVDGSEKWSTTAVAKQVKLVRGYFARVRDPNVLGVRNLIVYFNMWQLGGEKEMSCRIKGVTVKHSETIVAPNCNPKLAYPLRSDITVDLRLWTKGGANDSPTQDLKGLVPTEEVNWY